eukprot:CAMPEP_0115151446 /NCGR_PEP_ID=MMETSP0227-20121206/65598_1 /TAXON_ID=89957 /ORGANISM="Polarella glacialis, Strain CCMP 1383" /LENGTH=406 /DNA_ID=CAMNT_0002561921 /DNA_START=78 /DNA_END=1298 /DNA_ORIENTATION=+
MDAQIIINTLNALDDVTLSTVLAQLLQSKPELAPALVSLAIPDLTYAPAKAMTERRCSGRIKKLSAEMGLGFIDCPELSSVFGCDVIVSPQQVGAFLEGQEVNFAVTLNDKNKPQAFDLLEGAPRSMGMGKAGGMGGMMGMMPGMGDMSGMGMTVPGMMGGMTMPGMPGMEGMGEMGDMMGMGGMPGMGMDMKGMGKGGGQETLGEFFGVIKTYNQEKGFGFIACDALKQQYEGDVYLHQKHIANFMTGMEVKFTAYLHNGRLQGRDLVDAAGMVGPQQGGMPGMGMPGMQGMPGMGGMDEQELGVFIGKIKAFNHDKGFGFIACDALNMQGYQGDVFLHSKYRGNAEVGQEVAFTAVLRNGKLQGKDLQDPMSGMMGMGGGCGMPGMMDPSMMMGGPPDKRMRMM